MNASQIRAVTAIPLNRCCHYRSSKPSASLAFGVLLAVLSFVLDVQAQGTVNFSMTVPGVVSTRVYMPETNYPYGQKFGNTSEQIPPDTQTYSGAPVSGSNFVAQLWVALGANQPENAMVAFTRVPFRTGADAGTVQGGTVTLPGVPADCPVATVQVRVWQALWYGQPVTSWDSAFGGGYGGVLIGKSLPFNVEAIGGGTNPPPNLVNLRSFSLIPNALDFPVTPLIYVQPQHQSVPSGSNASFTVEVSCPAYLIYTWRFNGTNLVSGWLGHNLSTTEFAFPPPIVAGGIMNISMTEDFFLGFPTTNVVQLTNVQPSQAGIYSMEVDNISGGPFPRDPILL